MNKYRVKIKGKPCGLIEVDQVMSVINFVNPEDEKCTFQYGGVTTIKDGHWVTEEIDYITENEDLTLSVYAKAKRNLDLSKYTVTLELPGKGDR